MGKVGHGHGTSRNEMPKNNCIADLNRKFSDKEWCDATRIWHLTWLHIPSTDVPVLHFYQKRVTM